MWREFGLKVFIWHFSFGNYTKSKEYEDSEKNAVSETKMPQLSNLKYSCSYRNAPIYWGFSAHPSMEKSGRRIWVAEGQELGANLLRVRQTTPPSSVGRGACQTTLNERHQPPSVIP